MRVLLDIKDDKAILIEEIKEAVDNLALVKQGKLKLKSARDLYKELLYKQTK